MARGGAPEKTYSFSPDILEKSRFNSFGIKRNKAEYGLAAMD
jgi:hypothetical protein